MNNITVNGATGYIQSIDYDNKTATVEMDNHHLVEYPWDKIFVN